MSSVAIPAAFAENMRIQLGEEYPAFVASLADSPPVSIRWNPAKAPDFPPAAADRVPWEPRAEYLAERPVFTLDPRFQAGAYYVQEASSMLVGAIARRLFAAERPVKALDLCAAPGGKSTHLAAALPTGSLLLANEVIKSRYSVLRYNLAKWAYPHTWTTSLDPERYRPLAGFFDLVLVDAPCSGEGLFRRDAAARAEWSPDNVRLCAGRQQRILGEAAPLVAPGGYLLYSTCTYNAQENLDNLRWLRTEFGLESVTVPLPEEWGLAAVDVGAYQCYPHRVRGEGFFITVLRNTTAGAAASPREPAFKHWTPLAGTERARAAAWLEDSSDLDFFVDSRGNWQALGKAWESAARGVAAALGRVDLGFPLGVPKGKSFVPAPELAFRPTILPPATLEANKETALALLRKETPLLTAAKPGWYLVHYAGLGLAWVKHLGNRYNNYYPKEWRIRM